MDNIFTVKQVAKENRISERRVTKLLQEGRLRGIKHGRVWIVFTLKYTRKTRGKDKAPRSKGNK